MLRATCTNHELKGMDAVLVTSVYVIAYPILSISHCIKIAFYHDLATKHASKKSGQIT